MNKFMIAFLLFITFNTVLFAGPVALKMHSNLGGLGIVHEITALTVANNNRELINNWNTMINKQLAHVLSLASAIKNQDSLENIKFLIKYLDVNFENLQNLENDTFTASSTEDFIIKHKTFIQSFKELEDIFSAALEEINTALTVAKNNQELINNWNKLIQKKLSNALLLTTKIQNQHLSTKVKSLIQSREEDFETLQKLENDTFISQSTKDFTQKHKLLFNTFTAIENKFSQALEAIKIELIGKRITFEDPKGTHSITLTIR